MIIYILAKNAKDFDFSYLSYSLEELGADKYNLYEVEFINEHKCRIWLEAHEYIDNYDDDLADFLSKESTEDAV